MTTLKELNNYGKELEASLHLKTSPIAIKLLKSEEEIPEGAIRPKRDLGCLLGLCQGFAMSRRENVTVAMLMEDNNCYIPVLAFGLAKPPKYYLEGHTNYPERIGSLEAAKNWAENYPQLEYGKCIGVVSAPLKATTFIPDLVTIYCDSAQLRCLLVDIRYKDGYLVKSTLEPSGACVTPTIPVIQTGECQVSVPCGGDRKWALAQDDEMIFSLPTQRIDDLMLGLRHFDESTSGYTSIAPGMRLNYPLGKLYVKVGKMIGMDVHE